MPKNARSSLRDNISRPREIESDPPSVLAADKMQIFRAYINPAIYAMDIILVQYALRRQIASALDIFCVEDGRPCIFLPFAPFFH